MAHPLPPGLTPSEVSFLCEMEMVTVVPRGRLDGIELLSVRTPPPLSASYPFFPVHLVSTTSVIVIETLTFLIRAPHLPSDHLIEPNFPSGSLSSSRNNAVQISYLQHGYIRPLSPRSFGKKREKTRPPSASHHPLLPGATVEAMRTA